jgi:hypothetical protein
MERTCSVEGDAKSGGESFSWEIVGDFLWNIWSATLWLLRQQLFSSFFSTFLSHAVIWLAVGTKRWSKENAFCFADWSIKKTYTVSPPKPLKKEQREKLLKLWYFQAYVIILYEFL